MPGKSIAVYTAAPGTTRTSDVLKVANLGPIRSSPCQETEADRAIADYFPTTPVGSHCAVAILLMFLTF